jgi:hypothetical protein
LQQRELGGLNLLVGVHRIEADLHRGGLLAAMADFRGSPENANLKEVRKNVGFHSPGIEGGKIEVPPVYRIRRGSHARPRNAI